MIVHGVLQMRHLERQRMTVVVDGGGSMEVIQDSC